MVETEVQDKKIFIPRQTVGTAWNILTACEPPESPGLLSLCLALAGGPEVDKLLLVYGQGQEV